MLSAIDYTKRNSTNFPRVVLSYLNKVKVTEKDFLKYHQKLVYEYFIARKSNRGLLIYHQVGTGKSILAASIATYYKKTTDNEVILLLPKSLKENFKKNIAFYVEKTDQKDISPEDFKYVNFSVTMAKKISQSSQSKLEAKLNKKFDMVSEIDLEGKMLIIDEAHHFFQRITNGSKSAITLYDAILKARNIKLIFLTGTPIVNKPFDIVPCFNMLGGGRSSLFPENQDDFDKLFTSENKFIKRDVFKNRIWGLSSYAGDLVFSRVSSKTLSKNNFPDLLPVEINHAVMSKGQYKEYLAARKKEMREASFGESAKGRFEASKSTSTYRSASRQISIFHFPGYAMERVGDKYRRVPSLLKPDVFLIGNLQQYSPKFVLVLKNIRKYSGLHVVYSEWIASGLNLLGRVLDNAGISYGMFHGGITEEERANIIKQFTSEKNKLGKEMRILLISAAGAEGLDLKNVRGIHVMSPYFNMSRIDQVIARAVRYKSHVMLPVKDRNVRAFVYLSVIPGSENKLKQQKESLQKESLTVKKSTEGKNKSTEGKKKSRKTKKKVNKNKINKKGGFKKITKPEDEKISTDEWLWLKAKRNAYLNDQFLTAIIESAIDCEMNMEGKTQEITSKFTCQSCAPTNGLLFRKSIYEDVTLANPCVLAQDEGVVAKEIEYDGKKYYYVEDDSGLIIYVFDPDTDLYVEFGQNYPEYTEVYGQIIDQIT